jgi:hypothetical protein
VLEEAPVVSALVFLFLPRDPFLHLAWNRRRAAPEFATLRGWLYEDRGNSRFLPAFDDGSINADPEKI